MSSPRTHASSLAWVEVDAAAISHNVCTLKAWLAPSTRVMAVVKANAYGHGLVTSARAALAGGAAWLGVARLEEAQALREADVRAPILVLGCGLPHQAPALVAAGVSQTVSDLATAHAMATAAAAAGTVARVHLKVDTGMGRVGVPVAEAAPACRQLSGMASLVLEGLCTHVAWDRPDDFHRARAQLRGFDEALAACRGAGISTGLAHAANSAITLGIPEAHHDMVRVGLLAYGLPPNWASDVLPLAPALSVKARLVQVKSVAAGTTVSYGGTHTAAASSQLAIVPVGYADGYSRRLSNRGQVLVRGRRCPVVGAVCMDQTVIDVTGVPGVEVGETAVLLGPCGNDAISVSQMAGWTGRIPHQVVSQLGPRLPRVFLNPPRSTPGPGGRGD